MALIPKGKVQFSDANGRPLAGGTVDFYLPNTTTRKDTFTDQEMTVPNLNPLTLDARGEAIIWGGGSYRQVVKDKNGNLIWDQIADAIVSGAELSNQTGIGGAGLVGFDGGTLAQFFLSKNNRVVDSIAALQALDKTKYTRAVNLSYYGAGDNGGNVAWWMDPADNFTLAVPVNSAFSTTTTGGALAAGTYYYRVSAFDKSGETLASTETGITTTGTTSTVTLNWGQVTGAAGYKIYGRTTGAQQYMITIWGGTITSWIDTGFVVPSGALPAVAWNWHNGIDRVLAADGGRWKTVVNNGMTALQCGIVPDAGATDNSARILAARNWVAGNPRKNKLKWTAGDYGYSSSPNWAISNSEVTFEGEVVLRYTGTDNCVNIDGGAYLGGVFNMRWGMGNKPIILGTSAAKNGIYCRSILQNSYIGARIDGCGALYAGYRVEFGVCAVFDFVCSNNVQGGTFAAKPAYGGYVTQRNAGELTSYCTFVNPVLEGVASSCLVLDWAQGNTIQGGTLEGSASVGLNLTANAIKNKVFGTDFEANTDHDVYCLGNFNEFYGINSEKKTTFDGSAKDNSLIGGTFQDILLTANTFGNLMASLIYNQHATTGTITDQSGSGTVFTNKNRRRDVRNNAQSNIENMPAATTSPTVSGGTFSYTNTSFNPQMIIVTGTNITGIQITHGGTVTSGLTVAVMYPLAPGDNFAFNYSGATPVVNVLTQ